MTSLIFGTIYLGHHAIVGHRREKRRVKNYERWEGLRDEYDEQKRTQRETRSLDIQRTGQYDAGYEEKPILSLRDQQEADDARTSWRPQETFTPSMTGQQQPQPTGSIYQPPRGRPQSMDISHMRSVSDMNGYSPHNATGLGIQQQPTGMTMRPLPAQQTGAWDDGLPQRLRFNRHNLEDAPTSSPGVHRTSSLRDYPSRGPPGSMTPRSPYAGSTESLTVPKRNTSSRSPSIPEGRIPDPEPVQHEIAGGQMAALIEGMGNTTINSTAGPAQRYVSAPMPPPTMAVPPRRPLPTSANPTYVTQPAVSSNLRGGEQNMEEWWQQKGEGQTNMAEWWQQHPNAALPGRMNHAPAPSPYAVAPPSYAAAPAVRPPVTQGGEAGHGHGDMQEWWK